MYLEELNDSKIFKLKLDRKTRPVECLLDRTKNGKSFEEIVNDGWD